MREKTLWRTLYETAARANEILALNIEDLDLGARRAVVRGKGGHRQEVVWASGTVRLLPRYLGGRQRGRPVVGGWLLHAVALPFGMTLAYPVTRLGHRVEP